MFSVQGSDVTQRFVEALLSQPPTALNLRSAKHFLLTSSQELGFEVKALLNDWIEIATVQLRKSNGQAKTLLDDEMTRLALVMQRVNKAQVCLSSGEWSSVLVFSPGQHRVHALGTIKTSAFGKIKRGVLVQPDPTTPGQYSYSQTKVAIKTSNIELTITGRRTTGEQIFENAEKELALLSLLARFNHPYVLSLIAAGRDDSHFVMLAPLGRMSVWDHVQNFEVDNLLAFIHKFRVQIGGALTFLHALGFAHRDVSLENILEMDDGSFRLIDFGLSTSLVLSDTESGKWRPVGLEQRDGRVFAVGKLRYLAPEFFQRNIDMKQVLYDATKADVFSLGICIFVIAYRAFPHQHVFRDSQVEPTVPQLLSFWNDHVQQDFFDLFALNVKLSWLRTLLLKNAALRPSCRDCVDAITVHPDAVQG